MSSKQAYLAERYMSGPKADAILARVAPQKKKKRKTDALSSSGVAAAAVRLCDDDGGWGDEGKDEGDDISEAVVTTDRGFKKRRVEERDSGWATIREGERQPKLEPEPETETGEEKPLIVDEQSAQAPFVGGLLTSKQLRSTLPRTKVVTDISKEEMAVAQETVYRDASGRKIDTKAERAEAARKKREREEKEAEKMEWGKGIVQREEQERRKLELEKQRTTAFARHADDRELNEELKARDRWNDPAAAFLTVSVLLCAVLESGI
jgi:pre-mRNA-splicing factor CWC26